MRAPRLDRRTFLRGAGGIGIALPLLDCMSARAAEGSPRRFLLTFGGFSLGADEDPSPNLLLPTSTGRGYALTEAGLPLTSVQDDVTLVSGLRIPAAAPGQATPAGGRGAGVDSFHWHVNPLFTGNAQIGDSFDTRCTGPSADQVAASLIGGDTVFEYLSYRAQAQAYIGDTLSRGTLTFRDEGHGIVPVQPYASPRAAFDSLFTSFVPADPIAAQAVLRDLDKRKSILDYVDRRMGGLLPRLGSSDQARLDQHLTEIRALELRLQADPVVEGGVCVPVLDPGVDAPIAGDYSDEAGRARVLADLVHMAFACDLTRVGALMYTFWQSVLDMTRIGGTAMALHDIHHAATTDLLRPCVRWHIGEFAYLVQKLRDTPEGAGNLLTNSAVVMLMEGGFGASQFGDDDNRSHSTENMIALTAGTAGGLLTGEHLVAAEGANHPANVLITALAAIGRTDDTLGDVTGEVPGLRG
jgi:hypothetical protein